jgi:hypothetical protein
METLNRWLPIEAYSKKYDKKNCSLPELFLTERSFGNRECTHFYVLPDIVIEKCGE